jgi:hypothetical protein
MSEEPETNDIEAQFRASWDDVEGRFGKDSVSSTFLFAEILEFLREMRALNYDEWFRLEQILYQLKFSRSKSMPLKKDQAFIHCLIFSSNSMVIVAHIKQKRFFLTKQALALTTEFRTLLELLMAQPID